MGNNCDYIINRRILLHNCFVIQDVGITLTQKQVAAIIMKLDAISVPREVCLKNRYWDPLVLDIVYNDFTGEIPSTHFEKGSK